MSDKRELYQSYNSYRDTLATLKKRIVGGLALNYYDCEDIGNKNTECTLGLCDDSIEASQDGVYQTVGQICPHDSRYFNADGSLTNVTPEAPGGCFYTCHIFQHNRTKRAEMETRIDAAIAKAPPL